MKSSTRKKSALFGGVAALAALGVAIGVSSGLNSPHEAVASDIPSPEAQLKVLSQPKTAADKLPAFLAESLKNSGLSPKTVRFIGEDQENKFWVSTHGDIGICLLTEAKFDGGAGGISCGDAQHLTETGIGLVSYFSDGKTEKAVQAHLIPDGYASQARTLNKATVGENLILGNPAVNGEETVVLAPEASLRSSKSLPTLKISDIEVSEAP